MRNRNRIFSRIARLFIAAIIFAACHGLRAQLSETAITINEKDFDQQFGWASAHNQQYCIITAPRDDDKGSSAGCAYLYKRSNMSWSLDKILYETSAKPYSYFGQDVALDGGILAISSLQDNEGGFNAGAVYIYELEDGSWNLKKEIYPAGDASFFKFGYSVDICGNLLVVGAPGADNGLGRAYIYEKSGNDWILQKEIRPRDNNNYHFGEQVAVNKNFAAICTKSNEIDSSVIPSVHVFNRKDGWTTAEILTNPSEDKYNNFGSSVAINDEYLVVSNPYALANEGRRRYAGSVIIYKFDNDRIVRDTVLYSENPRSNEMFGTSVAISGKMIAVSSPGNDSISENSGLVKIFEHTGKWNKKMDIKASDAIDSKNRYCGLNLSMDNYSVLASSPISGKDKDIQWKSYYYQLKEPVSFGANDKIQVLVTPNPADKKCFIQVFLKEDFSSVNISIYDNNGKLAAPALFEGKPASRTITKDLDLTGFPSGILFLSVCADNNEFMEKIIVAR